MYTSTYTVVGMTCGHCGHSGTDEVTAISGVNEVNVDLATGALTVSSGCVAETAVRDAVTEAGYALAV